ncbi:MAG: DUF1643 domain-containing protein [Gammaproteobacteria bacterium]|nr:DUF1643 domain-containing protein [Gammaproteobacteria bacterium]MBQ0839088.1 DUF1643 domain-containing protein [Gammaproteobacteria bacterium]
MSYDLYSCNRGDKSRFILGKSGARTLHVIGLNPSTANREKADTTVAKVEKVARNNGYDGFVMANLYPLRATQPEDLPTEHNSRLSRRNISEIIDSFGDTCPVVWAAWGVHISSRPYLLKACVKLQQAVESRGGQWLNFGQLCQGGHPRHPSRLSYSWVFAEFDIAAYLAALRR